MSLCARSLSAQIMTTARSSIMQRSGRRGSPAGDTRRAKKTRKKRGATTSARPDTSACTSDTKHIAVFTHLFELEPQAEIVSKVRCTLCAYSWHVPQTGNHTHAAGVCQRSFRRAAGTVSSMLVRVHIQQLLTIRAGGWRTEKLLGGCVGGAPRTCRRWRRKWSACQMRTVCCCTA